MAYQKGRPFLLKLGADGSGGTIGGSRNLNFQIGNEAVDVTNKDSAGARTLLEGAGTQSMDASFDGVVSNDATYKAFTANARAGTIDGYLIVWPDGGTASGSFLITNLSEQGTHNDAQTFSATLLSSGPITWA